MAIYSQEFFNYLNKLTKCVIYHRSDINLDAFVYQSEPNRGRG